ncbi:MAG: GNAT family N-acetyltransferase [Dehalococcoidales bacterium]|nr:GNAT family N-acetyltransferase [Dehalococcoidales bacterium]
MIAGSMTRLCRKGLSYAANDYAWKTDRELALLTTSPPLNITFANYLLQFAVQLRQPDIHEFAIETLDGRHIGNCACYEINPAKSEAEVGIIIGDRNYWDNGYGQDALSALVGYVSDHMKINRVHLKTLSSNKRALRCFAKCGFIPCGQLVRYGQSFILMELRKAGSVGQPPKA